MSITLIMGKRNSGKSFFAKKIIRDLDSVIVADWFGEYKDLPIAHTPQELKTIKKSRVLIKNDNIQDNFFDTIQHLKNRTIVFEEIDNYCSPWSLNPILDRLVRYGRHDNISIIGISRRPSEIHRHLTANASTIYCFNMQEPNDIKYFKAISATFAKKIQTLGQYEYAEINL